MGAYKKKCKYFVLGTLGLNLGRAKVAVHSIHSRPHDRLIEVLRGRRAEKLRNFKKSMMLNWNLYLTLESITVGTLEP